MAQAQENKKSSPLKIIIPIIIIVALFFCIAVGVLGFNYVKKQNNALNLRNALQSESTPNPTITPSSQVSTSPASTDQTSTNTTNWIRKNSDNCKISTLVPPESKGWAYNEKNENYFILNYTLIRVDAPSQPKDTDYSSLQLICTDNMGIMSADELLNTMESEFKSKNTGVTLKELPDETRWGRQVKVVEAQGGELKTRIKFYALTTSAKLYVVVKDENLGNQTEKSDLEAVFNSIEFK